MATIWHSLPMLHAGCTIDLHGSNAHSPCLSLSRPRSISIRQPRLAAMSRCSSHPAYRPCSLRPCLLRSHKVSCRVSMPESSKGASSGPSPQPLLGTLRQTSCAAGGPAPLEGKAFATLAAPSSSPARSVSTSAVSSPAASSAVLEPSKQPEGQADGLSIFPRSSTGDLFDIENLQDQVQEFMQKYERTQSGKEAETSAGWSDSLSADDQERLEVSRQRHKLELQEQGLASTSAEPAEYVDEKTVKAQATEARRRAREAKRLARKVVSSQDVQAKVDAAPAAKSMGRPRSSAAAKKASVATPSSKRSALASAQSPQSQRSRSVASRTAELRGSSQGKSVRPESMANLDTQRKGTATRKGRQPQKDQPFQIMFRSQNHLAHKLLTMEEEQMHANNILACRKHEEKFAEMQESMKRSPSWEEWAAACEGEDAAAFRANITKGRRSRAIFEQCNLRLVAKIAYKYIDRGLELEDLMSYGMTGLNRAIDRFEPQRGFKFSTYAHWWIRQVISRAVCDKGRTIRIPCHLHDLRSKAFKRMQVMAAELMREPTTAELAASLNVSERKIEQLSRVFKASASLEAPIKTPDEGTLIDSLAVEGRPDESAAQTAVRDALDASLSTLDTRERIVMRMRYGLDDGCPRTLEDIGKYFKVTRERIRQIEGKAFRKMSQPGRISVADTEWTNASQYY